MYYNFAKYCDRSIVSVKDKVYEYSSVCSKSRCIGQRNAKNRYDFIIADIVGYIDCEPLTIPFNCTYNSTKALLELIPNIDWSYWYNIYDVERGKDKESRYLFRAYERAGFVMKCNEDNGYYGVATHLGGETSVEIFPIDNITQIDSHPVMLTHDGFVTTHCMPSYDDYKYSVGKLSILVTIRGIIVYGTPNRYNISNIDNDDHILRDIINGDLICEFINWVDLGFKKHSYTFEHTNTCVVMRDGVIDVDLLNTGACKCHYPNAYTETLNPIMYLYSMYGDLIDYTFDYTRSQYDSEGYYPVSTFSNTKYDPVQQ